MFSVSVRSEPLPHAREVLHNLQSMKSIRMVKKYRDKSGRLRVASNLVGLITHTQNTETIKACPHNDMPGLYYHSQLQAGSTSLRASQVYPWDFSFQASCPSKFGYTMPGEQCLKDCKKTC